MFLFPGLAENSQDQEGNHFILTDWNSREFFSLFLFQYNPENSGELTN